MRAAPSAASLLKASAAFILGSALAPCLAYAAGARDGQGERAASARASTSAETSARVERGKAPGDFRPAAGTPAEAPAAFEFESGGFSYRVAANGNGRRVKGDKTRRYNLHLGGGGESIRRLYFSEYGDDLLLLCEVDGGENGASVFITRLEQPSMRALWMQSAPSDGVDALRRGGSLYLGGDGFVARLELRSGAYAWQHRDRREEEAEEGGGGDSVGRESDDGDKVKRREAEALIPQGRYVPAEVSADTVVFRTARDSAAQGARAVRVDRKTGKVISVE